MKKTIFYAALTAAVLLTGCTGMKQTTAGKNAKLPEIQLEEAQNTANTFMAQFLTAIRQKECQKINKAILTETVAANMTPDSFAKYSSGIEKHFGKAVNSVYVCDLSNPLYRSFIWKLTFERQTSDPAAKPIVADVLFQVQVVRIDNGYKVLNFIITR